MWEIGAGTRVFASGEDFLALRLVSKLPDLRAGNANLIRCGFALRSELRSDECRSQNEKGHPPRGTRVFACGEDSLTLRLTSELVDLRVANANLFFARERAKNKV